MGMILNFLRVPSAQLADFKADTHLLETFVYKDENYGIPQYIDLDKSWGGLLYVMTGQTMEDMDQSQPLVALFFNEKMVDETQDLGYGPAFYSEPEEVKKADIEIGKITTAELEARFDPEKMGMVYPGSWGEYPESKQFLLESFQVLKKFVQDAAAEDEAIITFMN